MSNTNIPTPHIECRDENLIAKQFYFQEILFVRSLLQIIF